MSKGTKRLLCWIAVLGLLIFALYVEIYAYQTGALQMLLSLLPR